MLFTILTLIQICLLYTSIYKKDIDNRLVDLLLTNGYPHKIICKILRESYRHNHNMVENTKTQINNLDATNNQINGNTPVSYTHL